MEHLKLQVGMANREWEILVIDNNSLDDTAAVFNQCNNSWTENIPLRYILESKQGISYARQRGIEEARGHLVAFLDDDNLPYKNWVATACQFADTHPKAGAFGGQIFGIFEVEPPPSFKDVQGLFAIKEGKKNYCYSLHFSGQFAPGAGLVVRKKAWESHVPRQLINKGVSAYSRSGVGDDIETQWYLHKAGWEIWHCAEMKIRHVIPAERFSEVYLVRFFKGIGLSYHRNRMLRYASWMQIFAILAFWVNDARKLLKHLYRYRGKTRTDPFLRGRTLMLFTMLKRPFMRDVK